MSVRVLEGHVISVLAGESAGHYHVACTSPPYWQLRSYGTPPQTWEDGWVGELGQEPSVTAYLAHLVAVFRAVGRVLRRDGTLWVNLAGCYFSDPGGQNGGIRQPALGAGSVLHGKQHDSMRISAKAMEANAQQGRKERRAGAGEDAWLKPLDYVDVPGLFAHAMQRDGWVWRSDIALVKRAPMPESVTGWAWSRCRVKVAKGANQRQGDTLAADGWVANSGGFGSVQQAEWADCPGCPRCAATDGYVLRRGNGRPTRAWERLLLFTKRGGGFYDCEGVREPHAGYVYAGRNGISAEGFAPRDKEETGGARQHVLTQHRDYTPVGRNARDWQFWEVEPLRDQHYAAFPSAIPAFAIRAGTSEWGCCPGCGAPWARVVRSRSFQSTSRTNPTPEHGRSAKPPRGPSDEVPRPVNDADVTTVGWRPTCRCSPVAAPVPCRVLDCFGGSGTTALAANRLGRDCTLVELKPSYAALARRRIGREPLSLFAFAGQEALGAPGADPLPLGATKQEGHPNRTVAGFNQRWKAQHGAAGALE